MFAGLFRRDGGPAAVADVDAMIRALPNLRRESAGAWGAGSVAMGPLTGIERAREQLLVGELLLTNARALTTELGVPSDPPPSDADVVLAAYDRWGERLTERLDGEFAFALWDGRRGRLLCARDPLGTKPFWYHLGARTIAFGSDADAVLCLPEVPRRLNERALAGYLTATFEDKAETGFLDVCGLVPGGMLIVDAARATFRTYWSPDPVTELRCNGDVEYEDAFRHALSDAVTTRLGTGAVGVSLSGGLDSSSIACVAGEHAAQRLHAYTAVFAGEPTSDERPWVAAVLQRCGASAHPCDPLSSSPLADWAGAPWKGATPACNPQVSVCRVTLQSAAQDAVPVMLHGFGGDQAISHGLAYLAELVGSGRLVRAAAEARALGRRNGLQGRRVARTYAIDPFVPESARQVVRRARRRPERAAPGLLRPGIERALGLGRNGPAVRPRTARASHVAGLNGALQPHVLAASHRVDAVAGVERRYPFLDRRLVELCLSLPGDQKLRDGWTRSIMRRTLADVLPDAVRLRAGKANLGPPFVRVLGTTDRAAIEAVVARPGALTEWIDPATLTELWRRCQAGGGDREWFTIWRVVVASRWLVHHGFDEARPG